ncbi:MAG: hypothetical protein R3C10_06860 [Pirellulales bacterium]|nr:hypothetical protein [Planctomycetales bacterium]
MDLQSTITLLSSTGLFTGDGPSTWTLAVIGLVCLSVYELGRRRRAARLTAQ